MPDQHPRRPVPVWPRRPYSTLNSLRNRASSICRCHTDELWETSYLEHFGVATLANALERDHVTEGARTGIGPRAAPRVVDVKLLT